MVAAGLEVVDVDVVELEVVVPGFANDAEMLAGGVNPHVAHPVAARFHDRHLNHDFRLGLVNVVDNFSRRA